MKRLTHLTVLLALGALAVRVPAQSPDHSAPKQLAEDIGAFLAAHHAHRAFSGVALVADQGEIVYQGAFGLANDDWQVPNRVDTKFRLASITKQFTAMLVLLLVEEGKLALDAPIGRYLPDYPAASAEKVTIHHLLNHTSGIPNYTQRPGFSDGGALQHLPVTEFVDRFCSDPLAFEPGSQFYFSNSGYYLLGAIAEAVTGQSYLDALRARVLDPLEMHDTGLDDQYAVVARRATGYEDVLDERRVAKWLNMNSAFAAGGLYSTVGDLWKWEQALRTKQLLSGELERKMFTPGEAGYGYGWHIDQRGIWHGGGIAGFATMIGRQPSRGQCVIVLGNSGGAPVPDIAYGVGVILQGGTPRTPTALFERALARTVLDDGIEAGLDALAKVPAERRRALEPAVNLLGYQLLWAYRTDEALRVFEFNTRAFPESSNVWDSLGEAHVQAGNRELAIANYRKALELDPSSATAKPALEKLEGM